jgi:hypothetical protein
MVMWRYALSRLGVVTIERRDKVQGACSVIDARRRSLGGTHTGSSSAATPSSDLDTQCRALVACDLLCVDSCGLRAHDRTDKWQRPVCRD